MRLIDSNVELLQQGDGINGVLKQIEIAGRTCYSEDTEVLTNSGWKLFSEVSNEDRVLTYVPETNEIVWDIPNVICREIEDSMIEINHANIKLCVTKNHRIYQSVPEKRDYSFITASQLAGIDKIPKSKQCRFRIPKYFINSKRSPDCIHIPIIEYETIINIGHGKVTRKSIKLEITKDFMVIAGAFIAEGHTNNHSGSGSGSNCQITQAEGTPLYNNVIQALDNLGWSYRIDKDPRKPEIKWIIINGGVLWVELFDYLFGKGSANKHLPPWFRQLPDDYLETMLENMYLGDGSHTTTRKERYISISQRLLEEVQEVFILLGKNASFTYDTNMNQKCSIEESTRDSWIISRNKHVKILPKKKRKVYCTSTNSGIIQIRYRGKTCWCGNCYKSENKITKNSSVDFVKKMIASGHYAMLEHGTMYFDFNITPSKENKPTSLEEKMEQFNLIQTFSNDKYSVVNAKDGHYYITTNYTSIFV